MNRRRVESPYVSVPLVNGSSGGGAEDMGQSGRINRQRRRSSGGQVGHLRSLDKAKITDDIYKVRALIELFLLS